MFIKNKIKRKTHCSSSVTTRRHYATIPAKLSHQSATVASIVVDPIIRKLQDFSIQDCFVDRSSLLSDTSLSHCRDVHTMARSAVLHERDGLQLLVALLPPAQLVLVLPCPSTNRIQAKVEPEADRGAAGGLPRRSRNTVSLSLAIEDLPQTLACYLDSESHSGYGSRQKVVRDSLSEQVPAEAERDIHVRNVLATDIHNTAD